MSRVAGSIAFLILISGLVFPPSIQAYSDSRATNQRSAARKVATYVRRVSSGATEVFVREFRGVGENNVGLAQLIANELKNVGVSIRRGAGVEVEGRVIRLPVVQREQLQGFTIRSTVVLPDGNERGYSVDVLNSDEGSLVVGKSGETTAPPDDPPGSKAETQLYVSGNVIRPSVDSPYGVEVLVERNGSYQALKPSVDDNLISVNVNKGDILATRLHNSSKFDAATSVMVDGLSRFAMADDPDRRGGFDLVRSGQTRVVKGFFRDGRVVDVFRVGEYSKSEAAQLLPDASKGGTFTIAFRAAWKEEASPPPNELPATKSVGIQRGPERMDPTVSVRRKIGNVRAVLKINYGE